MVLLYVGGYHFKHISKILGLATIFLFGFILFARAFPDLIPNRIDTWISRVESFTSPEKIGENYQKNIAMTAISDVPPPISMIMFPMGSSTSIPIPIAAAIGS